MFILKEITKGKSFARALFNAELRSFSLEGRILDVGGGKQQDYLKLICLDEGARVETVDIELKGKEGKKIDFEKDQLPFDDGVFDNVLVFNVLEHIFNYNFLVGEMERVLSQGGNITGFVPFLVNYHPDPHDYFRYTKESLRNILEANGFHNVMVKEIGRGPFAVNYNNIVLSLPLFVRVFLFPFYYVADSVLLTLRPQIRVRYPLGYLFVAQK